MPFEYSDGDGETVHASPLPGVPAILLRTSPNGAAVPADQVEEVVAGIRDAARTASGQQPKHRIVPVCDQCSAPWATGHTCADPTTADDPTPLRWGLNDVLWGDDDTVTVCLSGPDREPYWLELDAERAAALRDDLTPDTKEKHDHPAAELYFLLVKAGETPEAAQQLIYAHAAMAVRQHTALNDVPAVGQPAEPRPPAVPCGQCGARWSDSHGIHASDPCKPVPAVGQPAEAHDTEARPELRERIAALFRSPAGAERLGDATPGEIADAVLSVLTVEDER